MNTPSPASARHPFDAALDLSAIGDAGDGRYGGHTSPAYANMIGPFGGITAAALLQAVMLHPARLGDPLAFTLNYAGPIADGAFEITARPARTNRSTQHWSIALTQDGETAATATAITATRRETWSSTDIAFPDVPPADAVAPAAGMARVAWTNNYDMRFVDGAFPELSGDEHHSSTSRLWVRDQPPRPLDFVALAALCDIFFPRIYLRRRRFTPAGTVSMTVYVHADRAMLAAQGAGAVLATARAQRFGGGYFDQSAEIWSRDGHLLATSHQVVYYKE